METIKISIAGMGLVGKELIKILPDNIKIDKILIKNFKKHFEEKNITLDMDDLMNADLIVDVMDDQEASFLLMMKCINLKKDIVMCNKEFVKNNLDLICNNNLINIYLHSIVSSKNIDEFPPLNNYNIKSFVDKKLFAYRGGGPSETAKFILNDILKKTEQ